MSVIVVVSVFSYPKHIKRFLQGLKILFQACHNLIVLFSFNSTLSDANVDNDVYLIKTDASGNVTSTFNIPINPNRKLEKTVDILGKKIKPQTNIPFIEIYDDGTVEKRIVIE